METFKLIKLVTFGILIAQAQVWAMSTDYILAPGDAARFFAGYDAGFDGYNLQEMDNVFAAISNDPLFAAGYVDGYNDQASDSDEDEDEDVSVAAGSSADSSSSDEDDFVTAESSANSSSDDSDDSDDSGTQPPTPLFNSDSDDEGQPPMKRARP